MAGAMVSDATIREFVESAAGDFEAAMEAHFRELDTDHDGVLSKAELRCAFRHRIATPDDFDSDAPDAASDALFRQFDVDGDGAVNVRKFTAQMRDMAMAMAHGMRGCPLHVLLPRDDHPTILARAVQHEQARLLLLPIPP